MATLRKPVYTKLLPKNAQVELREFKKTLQNTAKNAISEKACPFSCPQPTDPMLSLVVARWPELDQNVRELILSLINRV